MSIQILSVSKNYGVQKALNKVSFSAKKGEIIGFIGPNGAGKSTLMKILTGFISSFEGEVFIDELSIIDQPIAAKKKIGYLPEHNPLYAEMYIKEYLLFQASLFKTAKDEVEKVIEKVGLSPEKHKKIGQLSKGYRQRVGLAAAILHNPDVLILDEPTTGLDPNQLVEIREIIKELGKDKTVLFSTHIMQEVEAVCNRVIIIKEGTILVDKSLHELQNNKSQVIEVTFNAPVTEEVLQRIEKIDSFKNNSENSWTIAFKTAEDMRPKIFDFAQENGLKILALTSHNKNLERLFQELTA
jgi:ABC-2 type transport system ATP-binding protein